MENTSQSHGASPAIWDHTVLPVTRRREMCPTLTPARETGTRFAYLRGMTELTLVLVTSIYGVSAFRKMAPFFFLSQLSQMVIN